MFYTFLSENRYIFFLIEEKNYRQKSIIQLLEKSTKKKMNSTILIVTFTWRKSDPRKKEKRKIKILKSNDESFSR